MDASWELFVEHYPQVMAAYRKVAKLAWFQNEGWVGFVGHYTHGIFMQLYKPHWYNHDFNGIHFELALDAACVEKKIASLQLHITHKTVLPDRDRFNAITIPKMEAVVIDWDAHYQFIETKLSERLSLTIPVTKSNFAQKIAAELTQVCQLGLIIDDALSELWPRGTP